jgi:hypothetical protein
MPDFFQLFPPQDPDLLRIVAGFWQLDLQGEEPHTWAEQISAAMRDPAIRADVMEELSPQALAAFEDLVSRQGNRTWMEFAREFGEIREMGAGKRDRERPHENPASISEMLYYRGLIAKVFLPENETLREYACLPSELLPGSIAQESAHPPPLGKPAGQEALQSLAPASDRVLDHCTVLLAAIRCGMDPAMLANRDWSQQIPFLKELLRRAGILKTDGTVQADAARSFLEQPRPKALSGLVSSWLASRDLFELQLIPGIMVETPAALNAVEFRKKILSLIASCPKSSWWSMDAFLASMRSYQPDILREGGDYDRWFVRDTGQKELRGFEHWLEVEGGWIRLVLSILNWLGLADLGFEQTGSAAGAFRLPADFDALLKGQALFPSAAETGKLPVTSTGQVLVPFSAPRVVHYQVARYSEWGAEDARGFRFRVTAASLTSAGQKGLKAGQLLALLQAHSLSAFPPALLKSLEDWQRLGSQARLERHILLKVDRVEILDQLLASQAAAWLGERLNPLTVVVKPGRDRQVLDQLARLGYLGETRLDV